MPTAEGEDKGERRVNSVQSDIVRHIFVDYGERNLSPKGIAAILNSEGVPGPRGGNWSQSTINGNRKRGTGILNNEIYVGVLVWNRLRYVKDPETERRRSQLNPADQWIRKDVSHLRIVDEQLWASVRKRQAILDEQAVAASDGSKFHSKARPVYLFSGLIRCDGCGGGFSMISATHLGCSNARNKGETFCTNRRTMIVSPGVV